MTFNLAASSQLATQLGQGARADVFASADQSQMDNAKKADAIAGQDVFSRAIDSWSSCRGITRSTSAT